MAGMDLATGLATASSLRAWTELSLAVTCLAVVGVLLRLAHVQRSPASLGLAGLGVPLLLALSGVHALSALEPRDALAIELALTGLAALLAALLALRLPGLLGLHGQGRGAGANTRQPGDPIMRPGDDGVSRLAAGLADEASQPLNVAALWLRRARAARDALPAAERETFEQSVLVVEDQLRRAGAIVGQIRDLSPPHAAAPSSGPARGASAASHA